MKTHCVAIGCLSFAFFAFGAIAQQPSPRAMLTVRVANENGDAINGAQVTLTFFDPSTGEGVPLTGETNESGRFSAEAVSTAKIGGRVHMDGYYPSGFPLEPFRLLEEGRWMPWNPEVPAVLRAIGKPTPMFAKHTWIELPVVGEPCAYDLMKGDWVAPYGNGVDPDLVFNLTKRFATQLDFEAQLEVRFSNVRDGIQEAEMSEVHRYSFFKWARESPSNGYDPALIVKAARTRGSEIVETANEKQAYFIRVRTIENNGRIESALYGKIRGGLLISLLDSKTCKVRLTYYLNAIPLDRNMEWDPAKNLILNLGRSETPREP